MPLDCAGRVNQAVGAYPTVAEVSPASLSRMRAMGITQRRHGRAGDRPLDIQEELDL